VTAGREPLLSVFVPAARQSFGQVADCVRPAGNETLPADRFRFSAIPGFRSPVSGLRSALLAPWSAAPAPGPRFPPPPPRSAVPGMSRTVRKVFFRSPLRDRGRYPVKVRVAPDSASAVVGASFFVRDPWISVPFPASAEPAPAFAAVCGL